MTAIAWSYNATTGLCSLAIDGISRSVVSVQTFTHDTVVIGRFRSSSSIQSYENHIFAFLLSPVAKPEYWLRAVTANPNIVMGDPTWELPFDTGSAGTAFIASWASQRSRIIGAGSLH